MSAKYRVDPSSGPRRVLFIVNLDPTQKFGSLEEQIVLLSRALSGRGGLLVPVYLRLGKEAQSWQDREASPAVEALDLNVLRIGSMVQLVRMIDRYGINIIHWNLYPPVNFYSFLIRFLRPAVRQILTDHISRPKSFAEKDSFWKKALKQRLFAGTYAEIYAVSDYIQSDLKSRGIWRSPKRYRHFVNTDRFKPDVAARSPFRILMGDEQAFIMLVVAHLITEKGVDVAIHALAKLPLKAVLWIIGDGPERSRLQALAQSLGVQDRVLFLGLQADVSRFMQAADCLLCPSLWQEAAGLVILEAMACGLPVVASSIGGIQEFVMSGQTGYLFPAGDRSSLVDSINSLMGSSGLLESMSKSARAHAVTHFSHTTGVGDALSLYNVTSS